MIEVQMRTQHVINAFRGVARRDHVFQVRGGEVAHDGKWFPIATIANAGVYDQLRAGGIDHEGMNAHAEFPFRRHEVGE
jgi:hypothetical protein